MQHDRVPVPKYLQLHGALVSRIEAGLGPHDPIPSEYELADEHGMSRMTVRKAVDQLVHEGVLYRVPGVGTFVADKPTSVELHLSSFSEDMRTLGIEPGQTLLDLCELSADATVADNLRIPIDAPVARLMRLRTADARPVCIETSYLRSDLLPDFVAHWNGGSLYDLLDTTYSLRPTWSRQRIGAVSATHDEAELLGISVGSPLLVVRQHAFHDETLIEYCTTAYRPDRYELEITLDASGIAMTPTLPH